MIKSLLRTPLYLALLSLAYWSEVGGPAKASTSGNAADIATVRRLILAGVEACATGRPLDALAIIDREVVLTYPNVPDQTYAGMVRDYGNLCRKEGENTLISSTPEFEELSVNGDVVVARMIWSTRRRGMPDGSVRRMRDLQIWRRTPQGWRLWRGAHWPLRDQPPQ